MFYDEIEQTLRELALGPEDEPREGEWEDDGREISDADWERIHRPIGGEGDEEDE